VRRYRIVTPLRREVRVVALLTDALGKPIEGKVDWVTIAGVHRTFDGSEDRPEFLADRRGLVDVPGVPFLRGETLDLDASGADPATGGVLAGSARILLSDHPADRVLATIVLEPVETFEFPEGHGGFGCGGSGCDSVSLDSVGALDVLVLRRDGTPAASAEVHVWPKACRQTNAFGRVVIEEVPVGKRRVALRQPGLVPTATTVEVEADRTTYVVLREPEGSEVEVTVVDDEGRPLPFATVEVEQPSDVEWLDLDDAGTQRFDAYTDHVGRRTFAHLEPGKVEFSAAWASRKGTLEAELSDRSSERVRIVVHRPK
jgi:hypothetical protein